MLKPRVLSSAILLFLAYFLSVYFVPFFALQLSDEFQISEQNLGKFFLAFSLAGLVSATPGMLILRQFLDYSSIMVIGALLALIGNTLMGFCPLF